MGKTVVFSDLHLGATGENDLVRVPLFRDRLLAEVEGAERVVLLGDVIELRDRPIGDALRVAAPFFDALGEVAGDAEIIYVPGNHDHHVFSSWRESQRLEAGAAPMEFEQLATATSGPIGEVAKRLPDCEVLLAYPGIWLADGVYATHGHYLDIHLTVPTFERLGVGAVERVIGGLPAQDRTPDDYERVLAPLYAFLFSLAQSGGQTSSGPGPSARVWAALAGGQSGFEKVKGMLLGSVALPGAIAVANRLGIGRFNPDLSLTEISRATLAAMIEAIERLEIDARTVIFGHTHRRGPEDGDTGWRTKDGTNVVNTGSWVYSPGLLGSTAADSPYWPEDGDAGWRTRAGTNVVNTGSWVYSPGLLGSTAADSPYWPGTIAIVEGTEVELRPLLDDVPHAQMRHGLEDSPRLEG